MWTQHRRWSKKFFVARASHDFAHLRCSTQFVLNMKKVLPFHLVLTLHHDPDRIGRVSIWKMKNVDLYETIDLLWCAFSLKRWTSVFFTCSRASWQTDRQTDNVFYFTWPTKGSRGHQVSWPRVSHYAYSALTAAKHKAQARSTKKKQKRKISITINCCFKKKGNNNKGQIRTEHPIHEHLQGTERIPRP